LAQFYFPLNPFFVLDLKFWTRSLHIFLHERKLAFGVRGVLFASRTIEEIQRRNVAWIVPYRRRQGFFLRFVDVLGMLFLRGDRWR
jgi:hypothetical protein